MNNKIKIIASVILVIVVFFGLVYFFTQSPIFKKSSNDIQVISNTTGDDSPLFYIREKDASRLAYVVTNKSEVHGQIDKDTTQILFRGGEGSQIVAANDAQVFVGHYVTEHNYRCDSSPCYAKIKDLSLVSGMAPTDLRFFVSNGGLILINNNQLYAGGRLYTKGKDNHGIDLNNETYEPFASNISSIDLHNLRPLTHEKYAAWEETVPFFSDGNKLYDIRGPNIILIGLSSPKLLGNSFYVKGLNGVGFIDRGQSKYFSYIPIPGADPASFAVVSEKIGTYYPGIYYASDARRVYYKGSVVVGADPLSFSAYPSSEYQDYASDQNHVYLNGKVIIGADPNTFKIFRGQSSEGGCGAGMYAKDSKSVYYLDRKINADPETLEVLIRGYAKDKNKSFLNGDELSIPPAELKNVECGYG